MFKFSYIIVDFEEYKIMNLGLVKTLRSGQNSIKSNTSNPVQSRVLGLLMSGTTLRESATESESSAP